MEQKVKRGHGEEEEEKHAWFPGAVVRLEELANYGGGHNVCILHQSDAISESRRGSCCEGSHAEMTGDVIRRGGRVGEREGRKKNVVCSNTQRRRAKLESPPPPPPKGGFLFLRVYCAPCIRPVYASRLCDGTLGSPPTLSHVSGSARERETPLSGSRARWFSDCCGCTRDIHRAPSTISWMNVETRVWEMHVDVRYVTGFIRRTSRSGKESFRAEFFGNLTATWILGFVVGLRGRG